MSLTILTLVSVLSFCLYGMYGLSSMIHYQKMDELRLEKDIAVITFNSSKHIEIKEDFKCIVREYEWLRVEEEFSNGCGVQKKRVLVNDYMAQNCSFTSN